MKRGNINNRQKGAASLFVVIFTAVLFVAVTVSFTILMLNDQRSSTDNDLAQSALDSANAGTEDAKRVLAQLADCQERGQLESDMNCQRIQTAVKSGACSTISQALNTTASDGNERKVQQSEGDNKLSQAYTCVKISPDTDTYVGKTKDEGDIRVIPLKSTAPFTSVRVSWLTRDDMGLTGNNDPNFALPTPPTGLSDEEKANYLPLLNKQTWLDQNRGALLRVGSMQYTPGSVSLKAIDNDARAAFLYPSLTGLPDVDLRGVDVHKPIVDNTEVDAPADHSYNRPQQVLCSDKITDGYLCTTTIRLPKNDPNVLSYLTLASMYRATSFQVTLIAADGSTVKFKNVQPEIDVTGRANDVFRRVVSRVESADANEAPYPRAELGVNGNVCKNFVVTDDPTDYTNYATAPGCTNPVTLTPY